MDSVYPDKTSSAGSRYAHTRGAVLARAQSCLHDLYHRPERMVIIVSHSAFLRLAVSGTCFANADYRIFEVSGPNGPHDTYKLVEWERTKESGGGMGRSPREPVEIGSGDLPPDPPQDSQKKPWRAHPNIKRPRWRKPRVIITAMGLEGSIYSIPS